jgi:hypothetical protein
VQASTSGEVVPRAAQYEQSTPVHVELDPDRDELARMAKMALFVLE